MLGNFKLRDFVSPPAASWDCAGPEPFGTEWRPGEALLWSAGQTDRRLPALLRVQVLRTDANVPRLIGALNTALPPSNSPPELPSDPVGPEIAHLAGTTGVRAYVDAALQTVGETWDGNTLCLCRDADGSVDLRVPQSGEGASQGVARLTAVEQNERTANTDATLTLQIPEGGCERSVPKWGSYDFTLKALLPSLNGSTSAALRDLYQLEYLEKRPAIASLLDLAEEETPDTTGSRAAEASQCVNTSDFLRYQREILHQNQVDEGTAYQVSVVRDHRGIGRLGIVSQRGEHTLATLGLRASEIETEYLRTTSTVIWEVFEQAPSPDENGQDASVTRR